MPLHAPTMYRRVPPLGAWPIHGGRGTPVGFWCSTEHLSPLAEHYATFSFFKVVYLPIGKVVPNLLFQGFFQVKVGEFQVLFKDCGFKGLLCHTELLLNEHSHDVTPGAHVREGRRTRWARILGKGVRRPYGTRGYVISQGGYNQGPPGPPVPRNLSFHPRGEHRGHGGTPGGRRRHGKVKVFSWVRKSMKGWVIFAFNLFKIIWGVNPDKILDIFLIVPG